MDQQSTSVDYQEALSIKVGKWLMEKGYVPADSTGIAGPLKASSRYFGILKRDPNAKPVRDWSLFFGFIKRPAPGAFLGVLCFERTNGSEQADEKNWVFEIYGREYVEEMRKLADEMAQTFKIKIKVRLTEEQARVENYGSGDD